MLQRGLLNFPVNFAGEMIDADAYTGRRRRTDAYAYTGRRPEQAGRPGTAVGRRPEQTGRSGSGQRRQAAANLRRSDGRHHGFIRLGDTYCHCGSGRCNRDHHEKKNEMKQKGCRLMRRLFCPSQKTANTQILHGLNMELIDRAACRE